VFAAQLTIHLTTTVALQEIEPLRLDHLWGEQEATAVSVYSFATPRQLRPNFLAELQKLGRSQPRLMHESSMPGRKET
jgi:hypothetical protein